MTSPALPDPVTAAVAAVASEPVPVPRWTGRVTLGSTGREIGLDLPADINPIEVLDLIGFLSQQLPREIVRSAQAHPRILVPR